MVTQQNLRAAYNEEAPNPKMRVLKKDPPAAVPSEKAVAVTYSNVKKKFARHVVLDELNLSLTPGKTIAVLGPNGSGKTTLIKSLLGMVLPESGEIQLNGKPIRNNSKYRQQIDYLPQIA